MEIMARSMAVQKYRHSSHKSASIIRGNTYVMVFSIVNVQ